MLEIIHLRLSIPLTLTLCTLTSRAFLLLSDYPLKKEASLIRSERDTDLQGSLAK